jgi:hypothetical protein
MLFVTLKRRARVSGSPALAPAPAPIAAPFPPPANAPTTAPPAAPPPTGYSVLTPSPREELGCTRGLADPDVVILGQRKLKHYLLFPLDLRHISWRSRLLSQIDQNQLISRLCLCLLNYPSGKLQNRMCRKA